MHPRSYLMQIEVPVPGSYSVGSECLTTEVFEQEETVFGWKYLDFWIWGIEHCMIMIISIAVADGGMRLQALELLVG